MRGTFSVLLNPVVDFFIYGSQVSPDVRSDKYSSTQAWSVNEWKREDKVRISNLAVEGPLRSDAQLFKLTYVFFILYLIVVAHFFE